ncbi:SIMPL domain-containing protein [Tsukamurella sp. NPDC003166]|uniref:SIMPL domain-containing protein n=1 Tax=Tsukamurella sp. NPDC003166 TaxID=3154444 RepID=UPI0033A7357A
MTNRRSGTARNWRVAGIALLAGLTMAGSVSACGSSSTANDSPREITAVGTGEASGKPDVLTVQLAVQHQAADVTTALNDASASAQKVIDAATANGVDSKDVQTANVRVNPRYGTDRQITSYEATQSLTVKVRKLDTASKLLGDLATAGGDATRISSVGFDIENDSALKATARDKAFAEAKSRAEQYAKLSGGKLGEVRTVSEGAAVRPTTTRQYTPDTAGVAASPVPIESGEQSLTVTVTVVWKLS